MARRLLVLASLLAAACQLEPGGRCLRDPDCLAGQHCSGDVCVSDSDTGDVGALCEVERDCAAWASCMTGRCVLAAGACAGNPDCPSWNSCAAHACVPLPGRCSNEGHCASWQGCQAGTNRCVPDPGRCGADADCEAWKLCDVAANECKVNVAGGFCDATAPCPTAGDVCDLATHTCAPAPPPTP